MSAGKFLPFFFKSTSSTLYL